MAELLLLKSAFFEVQKFADDDVADVVADVVVDIADDVVAVVVVAAVESGRVNVNEVD